MKTKHIIIAFSIVFFGCNQKNQLDETKLEIEIIQQTIFELTPEYPDILPLEIPFTDSEELSKQRFDSAKVHKIHQIDSLGLEIWLHDEMEIPHDDFFTKLKQNKTFTDISVQGVKKKKLNLNNINSDNKIRIIPKSKMDELPINNIGFVRYSRIFFNEKKDLAMFVIDYSDRTCTGGFHKYVLVKKNGKKWKIID